MRLSYLCLLEDSDHVIAHILDRVQPFFRKVASKLSSNDTDAEDYIQMANIHALKILATPHAKKNLDYIRSPENDVKRDGAINNLVRYVAKFAAKSLNSKGSLEAGYESAASLGNNDLLPRYAREREQHGAVDMDMGEIPAEAVPEEDTSDVGRLIAFINRSKYPFSPGHQRVLKMHFTDGLSKAEIARQLGVSKPRMTQLVAKIVEKLQAAAKQLGIKYP